MLVRGDCEKEGAMVRVEAGAGIDSHDSEGIGSGRRMLRGKDGKERG